MSTGKLQHQCEPLTLRIHDPTGLGFVATLKIAGGNIGQGKQQGVSNSGLLAMIMMITQRGLVFMSEHRTR